MKQKSFASSGFELVTKRTRKRKFIAEMNSVVPWAALASLIERKRSFNPALARGANLIL